MQAVDAPVPFPILTLAALDGADWEFALTAPLPARPSLELLEARRQDVLTSLDWASHDLAEAASSPRIQRAASRLIELSHARLAAIVTALNADMGAQRPNE